MVKRIFVVSVLALLLAGCGKSDFKSDGFKSIKYSLDLAQLQAMGFTCVGDKICQQAKNRSSDGSSETLFGKPTNIEVALRDGKVSVITVSVSFSDQELVGLYEDAFGAPQVSEYQSMFGGKVRRFLWLSSDNTSIEVLRILDPEPEPEIFKVLGPRSEVKYRDRIETESLLKEVKALSTKPKDL